MTEREQALMKLVMERFRPLWDELIAEGWQPEVILLSGEEIPRIPGFKVLLVVPLDPAPMDAQAGGRDG